MCEPYNLVLFFQDCSVVLGSLHFPANFITRLSISAEKPAGMVQNLWISFGEYCHLNNISSSDLWTQDVFLLTQGLL